MIEPINKFKYFEIQRKSVESSTKNNNLINKLLSLNKQQINLLIKIEKTNNFKNE